MEIRKKITYQFIGIVAIILLLSSIAIYISFSKSRKEEFYNRLASKAKQVAQMLMEIDEIDARLLRKIEENNPLNLANEKIIIFDYRNEKIYSNDIDSVLIISKNFVDEVRLKGDIRFAQKPYEVLGYFYTGHYDRIVVFIAATDIFGFYKLKSLQFILLVVFVISLVAVYFSGKIFAFRALQPISNIISQVDGISVSNLNERVNEGNGKDEIARLAGTFNKMLQRLETAFKIQKNFIANASHELRTPLTVITGQLEVILFKDRNPDEYKNTLISVLDEIKNLNHISNRLLLLAQTSSDMAEINFSSFRIDDALWQARNEILKRNKNFRIDINFKQSINEEMKLVVYGNELLIKTAFSNLMDNACKYSGNNKVNIILDSIEGTLKIKFIDEGIGIPPEELKMIFQPFYRSKRVTNIKGHGIGLSLVEKIISLHKGNVDVDSETGKGSTFTVTVPLYVENLL